MRSKFVGGACTVSVRSRSLSCKDPSPATTTHAENSGIFSAGPLRSARPCTLAGPKFIDLAA